MTTDWREPQAIEYISLFDVGPGQVREVLLQPCSAPGPYRGPNTKLGMPGKKHKCTRPAGHDGNHQRATKLDGPTHEWTSCMAKVWERKYR
jgi:hypothetical protein